MRYVFFGTPRISAVILERLLAAGMPPLALVCNPDRPVGRKQTLTPPPTKSLLLERGAPDVKIFQPEKIDPEFARRLSELAPDLFLVAAYGKIIPKKTLAIPRLGTIGVHFSLLPKYRGASPLQTAILQGEKETGVSLYLLDEKMDEGPILAYRKSQIPNRNYTEISEAFANMAGEMLIRTLPEFLAGKITPAPQVHAEASYTRKFTTADALVEPQTLEAAEAGDKEKAEAILRKLRALNPEPGVWTMRGGKRMKLLNAKIQNGKLILKEIQIEGEKPRLV